MTIPQKTAVLVAVPLIFEILLVGVLAFLQYQAEQDAARAAHAKAIVDSTNKMLMDCFSIGQALGGYHAPESYLKSNQLDPLLQTVRKDKAELDALVVGEDDALTAQIDKLVDDSDRIMQSVRRDLASRRFNASAFFDLKPTLEGNSEELFQDLIALRKSKIPAASLEHQAKLRGQIRQVLLLGLSFNVLLSIWLTVIFNQTTLTRIKRLMQNTELLASAKDLPGPMPGQDEIAELDRVFHEMAATLNASARKERAILENAVDVFCSVDASGRITSINPSCEKMWGFRREELIDSSLVELLTADSATAITKSFEEARKTAQAVSFENELVRKDKTIADMLWSILWSSAEQTFFCAIHDISERKQIERTKQDFLAMVSHDLRTPLTSANFALTALVRGRKGTLPEEATLAISQVQNNVEQLIRLVNDLLDVKRMEAGRLELVLQPCSVSKIVDRAFKAVQPVAEERKIQIETSTTAHLVNADEDRVVQVLVNVLANAIKFSNDGGLIILKATGNSEWAEFVVQDFGRGIAAEAIPHLFDPFHQVEKTDAAGYKGSGLGLAICKTIIEKHGGSITVNSIPGETTILAFTLPAANNASAAKL